MSLSSIRVRKVADRCLIALFVVALWLPLAGRLLGIDLTKVMDENRAPAQPPNWSWQPSELLAFPGRFDAYYGDGFGFRDALIRGLNLARVTCLKVSSSPHVIVGRKGWLYFAQEPVGADYHAAAPFTPHGLVAWQQLLEARRDWLARRGIRYLFVIAPDKQTIYPEYLPGSLRPRNQLPSRLDQLLAYLREHSDVDVLDLRPCLREARGAERIYHRTDSHWNVYGGYFAYRRLATELARWFPTIRPLARSEVVFETRDTSGGDLATMLGLPDRMSEQRLFLTPVQPRSRETEEKIALTEEDRIKHLRSRVTEVSDPTLPRAILFFDSFGEGLAPFLSENFRRLVYAPADVVSPGIVEHERPDIVIQLMVERKLGGDLPLDPLMDGKEGGLMANSQR